MVLVDPTLTKAILRYKGAPIADPTTVNTTGPTLLDEQMHVSFSLWLPSFVSESLVAYCSRESWHGDYQLLPIIIIIFINLQRSLVQVLRTFVSILKYQIIRC